MLEMVLIVVDLLFTASFLWLGMKLMDKNLGTLSAPRKIGKRLEVKRLEVKILYQVRASTPPGSRVMGGYS